MTPKFKQGDIVRHKAFPKSRYVVVDIHKPYVPAYITCVGDPEPFFRYLLSPSQRDVFEMLVPEPALELIEEGNSDAS